jgi:hypothetical protein
MRKLHPPGCEVEDRASSGGLLGLYGRTTLQRGCLLFPVLKDLVGRWRRLAMVESVIYPRRKSIVVFASSSRLREWCTYIQGLFSNSPDGHEYST